MAMATTHKSHSRPRDRRHGEPPSQPVREPARGSLRSGRSTMKVTDRKQDLALGHGRGAEKAAHRPTQK